MIVDRVVKDISFRLCSGPLGFSTVMGKPMPMLFGRRRALLFSISALAILHKAKGNPGDIRVYEHEQRDRSQ